MKILAASLALAALSFTACNEDNSESGWRDNCADVARNLGAWYPPDYRQFICLKDDGTMTAVNIYINEATKNGDVAIAGSDAAETILDQGSNWIEVTLTESEQQELNRMALDPCSQSGHASECAE